MNFYDDLNTAESAVRKLENAALALQARLGPHIDVLRLADDITRCAADLSRLRGLAPARRRVPLTEAIVIPDGDYDTSLWAGVEVDSEGLGGTRPGVS